MTPRPLVTLIGCVVLLTLACFIRLLVGGTSLALPETGEIFSLRAHRVVAGAIVGGALGLSGVMLQTLLRNPLAAPDLIGVSPGARFGVMLATYLHYRATGELTQWSGVALPAFLGALGALGLVYFVSQRRGVIQPATMILVGVIIGLVVSAGTVFLQFQMPDRGQSAVRWLMGSISDETTAGQLLGCGGALFSAVLVTCLAGGVLDATALSEGEAKSVGVRLGTVRTGLFVGAGLLSAISILLAGPIAFVGLIAPHVARELGGPRHRVLSWNATLAGAALVVLADSVVKGVTLSSGRLPVGVLTAALGGPFFLMLLVGKKRSL